MLEPSITDFNRLINNQVDAHEELTEQLTLIRHVVDFTSKADFDHPNLPEINAQFTVIEKLLKKAEAINQHLQATLTQHRSQMTTETLAEI